METSAIESMLFTTHNFPTWNKKKPLHTSSARILYNIHAINSFLLLTLMQPALFEELFKNIHSIFIFLFFSAKLQTSKNKIVANDVCAAQSECKYSNICDVMWFISTREANGRLLIGKSSLLKINFYDVHLFIVQPHSRIVFDNDFKW